MNWLDLITSLVAFRYWIELVYGLIAIGSICSPCYPLFKKRGNEIIIQTRYRCLIALVLLGEFGLVALLFTLISCSIDAIWLRTGSGLLDFVRDYGFVLVLFALAYLVILGGCGLKYCLLSRPYDNKDNPHFKIAIDTKLSCLDWVTFSAQNMLPAGYGDIIPISRVSRFYTVGATLAALAVTVLLLNFIILVIGGS